MRDEVVKPLVAKGQFTEAYRMIMSQRAVVEEHAREVGDYDADLDSGYNRLSVAMKLVETALVSLVPVAGEAALAEGASAWAVGGTAIAAGGGGSALAETGRELVAGEDVSARKIASKAYSGTLVAANALVPAATKGLTNVLAAGETGGITLSGAKVIASGTVSGTQSKLAGGGFWEGAAPGAAGSLIGNATEGLGPWANQPAAKVALQGVAGYSADKLTGGDGLAGAVGGVTGGLGEIVTAASHSQSSGTELPTDASSSDKAAIPELPATPAKRDLELASSNTAAGTDAPAAATAANTGTPNSGPSPSPSPSASPGLSAKLGSGEAVPITAAGGQQTVTPAEPPRTTLSHGTDTPGFHSLGGLGPGKINVEGRPGRHQDFGRGFYVAEGSSGVLIAEVYGSRRAAQRKSGKPGQVMIWEVDRAALGDVVDVGPGGEHEQLWKDYLKTPVPEHSAFGTVGEYLSGLGVERRGEFFDRFLTSIGKENADAVRGPLGTPETSGIGGTSEGVQWAIRSQKAADYLNAQMAGPHGPASPEGSGQPPLTGPDSGSGPGSVPATGPVPVPDPAAPSAVPRLDVAPQSSGGEPPSPTPPTGETHEPDPSSPSRTAIHEINDPRKAKGTLAELAVPFGPYSGSEWNNFGGGSESKSSRTSLARRSSHDERRNAEEGTAGIDNLAIHTKTDRFAINEQKATDTDSFVGATAITTYLEKNITQSVKALEQSRAALNEKLQNEPGSVDPDQIEKLQSAIDRLKATNEALEKGRKGEDVQLPEGVVFELTNIGGKGKKIGKEHIDLIADTYGENPAFVQHILDRTFVRDPELARSMGRKEGGRRGTDDDPDIVSSNDILTDPAKDRLEQIKAAKDDAQWAAQKADERAAADKAAATAAETERKNVKEQRANELTVAKEQARQVGEEARLEFLRKQAEQGDAAPTKQAKKGRGKTTKLERDAKTAGKRAADDHLKKFTAERKSQDDQERAARKAEEKTRIDANKQEREANRQARETEEQERQAAEKRRESGVKRREAAEKIREADRQRREAESQQPEGTTQQKNSATPQNEVTAPGVNDAVPQIEPAAPQSEISAPGGGASAPQIEPSTPQNEIVAPGIEPAKTQTEVSMQHGPEVPGSLAASPRSNEDVGAGGSQQHGSSALSIGTHAANNVAAALRGYDALVDDIHSGKGLFKSSADAAWTYASNKNPFLGALSTFEQRIQKDANGQQVYGDDKIDALLGTVGETAGGQLSKSSALDDAVNAGANLYGAVDDHHHKGQNANGAEDGKASIRTLLDVGAEFTPSRLRSTAIGGGLRSYYDISRAIGGDFKGVDKFADDALRGKLGSIVEPWAIAADFVGNLATDDAGKALDKTLKKTKGTNLQKLGDASGDAVYKFGQSKEAKSGKYTPVVQGLADIVGVTSDVIGGKSFEKAISDAADAGKGSIADKIGSKAGDLAFDAVQKGKEFINEDIPAAEAKAGEVIDKTKEAITGWWKKL